MHYIRIKPDWNVKWEGQIVGFLEKHIRIKPDWNVKLKMIYHKFNLGLIRIKPDWNVKFLLNAILSHSSPLE